MTWRRTASALVTNPSIHFDSWMEELRKPNEGASSTHNNRVAKTLLRKCDPNQYLLSHTTIVASVDTISPKTVTLGKQMSHGMEINVPYADFRVKPECAEIVNNNGDAWDRALLLNSYKTFVGAPVYLEHVQIPELSKGFIVDAIARDLGNSVYVDILMATDRKHKKLVGDIMSGEIYGASMGCISLFTICTGCGNIAADDAQLCPCILYGQKGTKFTDNGVEYQLAELIGHVSVPNSNQFIEASWVKSPAFRGAVRRNFLNAEMTEETVGKMSEASMIYEVRNNIFLPNGQIHQASTNRTSQQGDDAPPPDDQGGQDQSGQGQGGQGQGGQGQGQGGEFGDTMDAGGAGAGGGLGGGGGGGAPEEPQAEAAPEEAALNGDVLDKLVDDITKTVVQAISDRVTKKLGPQPEDVGYAGPPVGVTGYNSNLMHGASNSFAQKVKVAFPNNPKLTNWAIKNHKIVHQGGKKGIRASKLTSRDLILLSWVEDRIKTGRTLAGSSKLYKVAMTAGPMKFYPSEQSYLKFCSVKLGRKLTNNEKKFFVWKGAVASLAIG